MRQGVDYSDWRPASMADLSGVSFVCRYLSNDAVKNLTHDEAVQLTAWGLDIVANWESTGTGGNFAQGVADAQTAKQQAAAIGVPADRPIYFSIDEDVAVASQIPYFEGVTSVLPVPRVGVYGSAAMIQGIQAAGLAQWGWRTMSTGWSGGASTQGCQIEQIGGGANVDYDQALADDFGQWNLNTAVAQPATPTTTTTTTVVVTDEEELMQIDPLDRNPDGNAYSLTGQTKMSLTADGFGAKTALRFAFWVGSNVTTQVLEVGGGSVGHTLPAGCTGVTVTRQDATKIPVGIAFFS